jgi:hypothetical protein
MTTKPKWDYYPSIWKTEAEYLSWLRSQFRLIWRDSPQRDLFIRSKRIKVPVFDTTGAQVYVKRTGLPKMVNGFICEFCGSYLKESAKVPGTKKPLYAVDHKVGGHSLRSSKDIGPAKHYWSHMALYLYQKQHIQRLWVQIQYFYVVLTSCQW